MRPKYHFYVNVRRKTIVYIRYDKSSNLENTEDP